MFFRKRNKKSELLLVFLDKEVKIVSTLQVKTVSRAAEAKALYVGRKRRQKKSSATGDMNIQDSRYLHLLKQRDETLYFTVLA